MRKEWEKYIECRELIPTSVYRYWDETGSILYVGKARDFETRDKAHLKNGGWRDRAAFVCVEEYFCEEIALAAEAVLIRDQCPPHNIINRNSPEIWARHVRWFDASLTEVTGVGFKWMSCPALPWDRLQDCEAPEWADVHPVTLPVNQPTNIR